MASESIQQAGYSGVEPDEPPRRDSGRPGPETSRDQPPGSLYTRASAREPVRDSSYRYVSPRWQDDPDPMMPRVEEPRDYSRVVPPRWAHYPDEPDLERPPSRSRHVRRTRSRYRGDSESRVDISSESTTSHDETNEIDATEFEFKLSRTTQSESQGSHDPSDDEASSRAEKPTAAGAGFDPTVLKVYQSRYTGDASLDGRHSVMLVGSHSEPSTGVNGEKKEPLFRWLHISQDMMSFDQLSSRVTSIPWLTQTERNGLTKLLGEVRKNCIKTKQRRDRKYVKYMEPQFIQVWMKPDRRSASRRARTASWVSIPYFSLQKYSGGLLAATDSSSFPPLTLLQAQYSRIEPRRDTEFQVVRRLGEAAGGSCFHIAQLWCIVIGNRLLVTCGSMSEDDLHRNVITVKSPEPPTANNKRGSGLRTIFVSYGETVLWSFPLHECMTWPAFVSHFYDFWPKAIQLSHRDKTLSADNWNQILSLADSGHKIVLSLSLVSLPKPPPQGNLKAVNKPEADKGKEQEEPRRGPEASPRKIPARPPKSSRGSPRKEIREEQFRVFSWADTHIDPPAETHEDFDHGDAVFRTLSEIEDYLLKETTYLDMLAYQGCKEANRFQLFEYLQEQGSTIAATSKSNRDMKLQYEQRVDILNAADTIFQFFLPLGKTNIPTESKYWGAIKALIEMPLDIPLGMLDDTEDLMATWKHVPAVRDYLRGAASAQQHIQNLMTSIQPSDRAKLIIPDDWCNSWIHTLTGVIYAAQDTDVWEWHLMKADSLRDSGWQAIMKTLQSEDGSLLDRAVIQPMDLVPLLGLRLLQDSVNGVPHDIGATYSEYLNALDAEIRGKAPDRSFQHWISFLEQELAVIGKTVMVQQNILARWQSQPGRPGHSYRERTIMRERERERERERPSRPFPFARVPGGSDGSSLTRSLARGVTWVGHDRKYATRQYFPKQAYYDGATPVLNPEEAYKLSPTHPGGFRDLFASECQAFLERRRRDLYEYKELAAELKRTNAVDLEQNKDRQETALYAFTIVTIIFLPLSAVAGIFGMNTADIRNMDHGQWLYWATGVPVTVVVIIIGLWWTGDLRGILIWLMGRQPRVVHGSDSPSSDRRILDE